MLNTNKIGKKANRSRKALSKPLGRGLDSLFEANVFIEPTDKNVDLRIWNIALHKIVPGTTQPRKVFEKAKLQELANSIQQQGILQPVIVKRADSSTFKILAGERRWRASQMAGLKTIPAIIKEGTEIDEKSGLELALIENIQREDLNPIEEALAYYELLSKHKMTQEDISQKVGKDRTTITNALRLLKLDKEVQKLISEGKISSGHAKVLLGISNTKRQKQLAHQVVKKQLSVHRLAEIKKNLDRTSHANLKSSKKIASLTRNIIHKMAEDLQKSLGTKVQVIHHKDGKGQIIIQYYSNEQLTAISEKLSSVKA